jgi:hypothetical protein
MVKECSSGKNDLGPRVLATACGRIVITSLWEIKAHIQQARALAILAAQG